MLSLIKGPCQLVYIVNLFIGKGNILNVNNFMSTNSRLGAMFINAHGIEVDIIFCDDSYEV